MAVEAIWDDAEQMIVRFVFTSPWTWQELGVANEYHVNILAPMVTHLHASIMDFTTARLLPSGSFFQKGKEVTAVKPSHSHPTILVVGANAVFEALAGTFIKIYGGRAGIDVEFMPNLDAARKRAKDLLKDGTNDDDTGDDNKDDDNNDTKPKKGKHT